jgi:hypothetical protein
MLVVVAGLDAVVVVVAFIAGLKAGGAFGAADGVWAIATDVIANRVVSDKVIGLMVAGIVLRKTAGRQASRKQKLSRFLLLQQS